MGPTLPKPQRHDSTCEEGMQTEPRGWGTTGTEPRLRMESVTSLEVVRTDAALCARLRSRRSSAVRLRRASGFGPRRASPSQIHAAAVVRHMAVPVTEIEGGDTEPTRRMIDRGLAKAHAWIAGEHFERGEVRYARRHYLQSLRHCWWQPAIVTRLLLLLLPGGAGAALYRRLQDFMS